MICMSSRKHSRGFEPEPLCRDEIPQCRHEGAINNLNDQNHANNRFHPRLLGFRASKRNGHR
jgi:hypothetical protein